MMQDEDSWPEPIPAPPGEPIVRVFISSPFRDMQAERDELAKRVFPRLRKVFEERGIAVSEVDLRWGITDEERLRDRALPLCLAEIDACRPYFVGALGERYGWESTEFPPALLERHPWLRGREGASSTELEFEHGALRDPAGTRRAFFYLRAPEFIDGLPEAQRALYREAPTDAEAGLPDAAGRAEERRRKLARLKDRVRASGLPVHEGYLDPQAFGEQVYRDLERAIMAHFPAAAPSTPAARGRVEQEAFARERTRVYLHRPGEFDTLDAHADGEGPPLVVTAPSGLGKSALLANWAVHERARRPGRPVVAYFVGASAQSTDWRTLAADLLGALGIDAEPVRADADALRAALANGLHRAAAAGGCVLVIDALNQLEDREGALDLAWLPPVLPAGVRLVASTLEGQPLEAWRRRGWAETDVRPLAPAERLELIALWLERRYAKRLAPAHAAQIADAPLAGSPLGLVMVLEEIRLYGDHETLGGRIAHYVEAPTMEALFGRILVRWEKDYERERPGLVGDAMRALWAARDGLAETELRELLGDPGKPVPALVWSAFQLAADHALARRSGLLGFFHPYLRQAAEARYVASGGEAAHGSLAAYFREREPSRRRTRELPWQLACAGAWDELYALLAEPGFFRDAWSADELDVKRLWADTEAHLGRSRVEAYAPVLAAPARHLDVAGDVARMLAESGFRREPLAVYETLLDEFGRTRREGDLARALTAAARLRDAMGRREEALKAHARAERIFRESGNDEDLLVSLGEQAQIRIARGEPDAALALLDEAERLAEKLGAWRSLKELLVSRANVLSDRMERDEAEACLDRAEEIAIRLGDRDGYQRMLGYRGQLLHARRRYADAVAVYEEKARICAELGDRDGRAGALNGLAVTVSNLGDAGRAMTLLAQAEAIYREIGFPSGMAHVAGNRGTLLLNAGLLDEAREAFATQERLCHEAGDLVDLDAPLLHLGFVAQREGDTDAALDLFARAAKAAADAGAEGREAYAWLSRARVLTARGELTAAYDLLKDALARFVKLADRWHQATTLRFMADALLDARHLEPAMQAAGAAERISQEICSPVSVAASLDRQAAVLSAAGQHDDALAVRERELEIRRGLDDDEALRQTLTDVILAAHALGDVARMLAAIREQADLMARLGRAAEMRASLCESIDSLRAADPDAADEQAYLAGLEGVLARLGSPGT
jgi:tetratricopeptide (TPR) repeat protein